MIKIYLIIVSLFSVNEIYAQGGGPPMITDDPGTPSKGKWEINTSFNSDISPVQQILETPLLDINYGYDERTQLKIEFPYLLIKTDSNQFNDRFGDISMGVKYRFFDNDILSLSIYPQFTVSTQKGGFNEYLLPVQVEKHFGKLVLGADAGYTYIKNDFDFFQSGILVGYKFSDKFETMSELNFQIDRKTFKKLAGTINFGIRHEINKIFKFIASLGTGLASPNKNSKTRFRSFIGMQLNI